MCRETRDPDVHSFENISLIKLQIFHLNKLFSTELLVTDVFQCGRAAFIQLKNLNINKNGDDMDPWRCCLKSFWSNIVSILSKK